jgi:hypothetical protein
MENEEVTQSDKVIFGLSSKATLINAIVFAALSKLFWVIAYCSQFSSKEEYMSLTERPIDNVTWYYDLPLSILSIVLLLSWVEFFYKMKPGELSWRAFRYKFAALVFLTLLEQIFQVIFMHIILSNK